MVKQNRCRFWMCYVDGSGVPKMQHWDKNIAQGEAERLARELGRDVFLLEAVRFVRTTEPRPPVEWKETNM